MDRKTMKSSVGILCGALLLGGCSTTWPWKRGAAPEATAARVEPVDQVLAAASTAAPGVASRVVTADGAVATVVVERSYFAASGRECREVSTAGSSGYGERRILCLTKAGWAWSRPVGTVEPIVMRPAPAARR